MGPVHGGDVVAIHGKLPPETGDVVNRVIHTNTHCDGRDSNGHHVQGDSGKPHTAQYHGGGKHVRQDGNEGNRQ